MRQKGGYVFILHIHSQAMYNEKQSQLKSGLL